MTELVSIKSMSREEKIFLLNELGYVFDGSFIIDDKGEKVKDPYIDKPINIENMLILPGSAVIIDNNPLSIAGYMEDYPDVLR